jgi:hypothetical protein
MAIDQGEGKGHKHFASDGSQRHSFKTHFDFFPHQSLTDWAN